MTPQAESILAGVATLVKDIQVINGYATEVAYVGRRLLLMEEVEKDGRWPQVAVLRKPGAGSMRQPQQFQYKVRLAVWLPCYFKTDQSDGDLVSVDTPPHLLANDIEKCLYNNFASLKAVGAVDILFPAEPEVYHAPIGQGLVYTLMLHTASIAYFVPMGGF